MTKGSISKCDVFQVHQPKYFIFWDRRIHVILIYENMFLPWILNFRKRVFLDVLFRNCACMAVCGYYPSAISLPTQLIVWPSQLGGCTALSGRRLHAARPSAGGEGEQLVACVLEKKHV